MSFYKHGIGRKVYAGGPVGCVSLSVEICLEQLLLLRTFPLELPIHDNLPMLAAALALASAVNAYPTSISDSRVEACATGSCASIMSNTPMQGSALTVTGKSNGGTYTAGESISLSNSGGGQYVLYASAGGMKVARNNNAALTITAPSSGTLVLLGMRASGQSTVTYEKISLTLAAGGGGGAAASPSPPPPTAAAASSPGRG